MTNSLQKDIPLDGAHHLLIVDDDARIRQLLSRYLAAQGFRVTSASNAASARTNLKGLAFDLIILDVMMPGETGLELAKALNEKDDTPIILLTALADPEDRITGLETGVEDYITKPFEPRELVLRIENILKRRPSTPQIPQIQMGPFSFHIEKGELQKNGTMVRLTDKERNLLRLFATRPGTPISRHELAGDETDGSDRAVDVQINRLRRKLEQDPTNPVYLQTVRGKGYILHTD